MNKHCQLAKIHKIFFQQYRNNVSKITQPNFIRLFYFTISKYYAQSQEQTETNKTIQPKDYKLDMCDESKLLARIIIPENKKSAIINSYTSKEAKEKIKSVDSFPDNTLGRFFREGKHINIEELEKVLCSKEEFNKNIERVFLPKIETKNGKKDFTQFDKKLQTITDQYKEDFKEKASSKRILDRIYDRITNILQDTQNNKEINCFNNNIYFNEKDFIGRTEELKKIYNFVRNNINNNSYKYIFGEKGIGKTTIVCKLIDEYYSGKSAYRLVYSGLGSDNAAEAFVKSVATLEYRNSNNQHINKESLEESFVKRFNDLLSYDVVFVDNFDSSIKNEKMIEKINNKINEILKNKNSKTRDYLKGKFVFITRQKHRGTSYHIKHLDEKDCWKIMFKHKKPNLSKQEKENLIKIMKILRYNTYLLELVGHLIAKEIKVNDILKTFNKKNPLDYKNLLSIKGDYYIEKSFYDNESNKPYQSFVNHIIDLNKREIDPEKLKFLKLFSLSGENGICIKYIYNDNDNKTDILKQWRNKIKLFNKDIDDLEKNSLIIDVTPKEEKDRYKAYGMHSIIKEHIRSDFFINNDEGFNSLVSSITDTQHLFYRQKLPAVVWNSFRDVLDNRLNQMNKKVNDEYININLTIATIDGKFDYLDLMFERELEIIKLIENHKNKIDDLIEAKSYMQYAITCGKKILREECEKYMKKAYDIVINSKNKYDYKIKNEFINTYAYALNKNRNYKKALEKCKEAEAHINNNASDCLWANRRRILCYSNYAIAYHGLKETREAINYSERAIKECKRLVASMKKTGKYSTEIDHYKHRMIQEKKKLYCYMLENDATSVNDDCLDELNRSVDRLNNVTDDIKNFEHAEIELVRYNKEIINKTLRKNTKKRFEKIIELFIKANINIEYIALDKKTLLTFFYNPAAIYLYVFEKNKIINFDNHFRENKKLIKTINDHIINNKGTRVLCIDDSSNRFEEIISKKKQRIIQQHK